MNEKKIAFTGPSFSHALLQDRFDKILSPSSPLRSLKIDSFNFDKCSANHLNECFDRILSQDIYDDGLDKICLSFKNFGTKSKEPLDQRVLNKLAEISSTLT